MSFLGNLDSRDRRAITLLAAAALVFLIGQFVLLPVFDSAQKQRADLPMKEKKLKKYRSAAAMAPLAESGWKAVQEHLDQAQKTLLDAKTPALASAELQQRIQQMLREQGAEPTGTSFAAVRPLASPDSGYTVVPLAVTFQCTVDQLLTILLAMPASGKTLAIDQLSIDAAPIVAEKPRKLVNVRMVVHGLIVAEAPPAPESSGKGAA